jgi:hypothetical protein
MSKRKKEGKKTIEYDKKDKDAFLYEYVMMIKEIDKELLDP